MEVFLTFYIEIRVVLSRKGLLGKCPKIIKFIKKMQPSKKKSSDLKFLSWNPLLMFIKE